MTNRHPPASARDKGLTSWQSWSRCQVCKKRGYADKRSARDVRRVQIRDCREKISDIKVYRCDSGLFHLGHVRRP